MLLQVSGWPGQQLSIPIKMTDEANQLASEFIQLEPVDSNNQVNVKMQCMYVAMCCMCVYKAGQYSG